MPPQPGCYSVCRFRYRFSYHGIPRLNPTMLYDHHGQVAGVQFQVNHSSGFPLYPGSGIVSPYYYTKASSEDPGIWYTTVHFRDPSALCDEHIAESPNTVGDRLWSRISEAGNLPVHFEPLPMKRDDLATGFAQYQGWAAGGCMPSGMGQEHGMGQHYWRAGASFPKGTVRDSYPFFLVSL